LWIRTTEAYAAGGGGRSVAETIGLTTDDEAGLVYVSILGGEIRMVLMSHDCPVA